MDVKKSFGASVRVWRGQLGISQEELGGRAGLHRTYISDVERGGRNVSLETMEKLARALDVSIVTLIAGVQSPNHDPADAPFLSPNDLVDILFVEDRGEDVEMTLRALQDAGITNRVHVVRDGAAALHFLFGTGPYANRKADQRPRLILLDLNLPKIDGLEVLRRVKADPRTQSIPVVALTASSRDRDITTSKELGAAGYIVKPVDFRNLSEVTPKLSLHWALVRPTAVPPP